MAASNTENERESAPSSKPLPLLAKRVAKRVTERCRAVTNSCPYPAIFKVWRKRVLMPVCREHRKFFGLERGKFNFEVLSVWSEFTEQLWAESFMYACGEDQSRFVPRNKETGEFSGFGKAHLRDWKYIGQDLDLHLDDYRESLMAIRFIQLVKKQRREELEGKQREIVGIFDKLKKQLNDLKGTNGLAKKFVWVDLLESCRDLAIGESASFPAIGDAKTYRSRFLTMLMGSKRTNQFQFKTKTEGETILVTKTGAFKPLMWLN